MTSEVLAREFYDIWTSSPNPVIVRHAESVKNLEERRGGLGQPITTRGEDQAAQLSFTLAKSGFSWNAIVAGPGEHVLSTAKIMHDRMGLPLSVVDQLRGIHLGELSGLSVLEMSSLHPDSWATFRSWEMRQIPMSDFWVPGKESGDEFCMRVLAALIVELGRFEAPIFIVGRSLIILCSNIFRNEGELKLTKFYHESWGNCEGFLGLTTLPTTNQTR